MSELARLETVVRERVLHVVLSGEVDASNAEQLEGRITQAAGDARGLVVDLTGVTFLESAGVRLLDHLVAAREPEPPVRFVVAETGAARFSLRVAGFRADLLAPDLETATSALAGLR